MAEHQSHIPSSGTSGKSITGFTGYLLVLAKWRSPICWTTIGIGVLTAAYLWFFVPNVYESSSSIKTSVVTSLTTSSISSMLNVKGLGDIGGMLGAGGQKSDLDQYIGVLNSKAVISEVVRRYGLQKEYQDKYFEDAVKEFSDHVKYTSDRESQLLTISVQDTSSIRAQKICTTLIELLDSVNKSMARKNAHTAREYLELRYAQGVRELALAEDSLRLFQIRYKVYDMKDQATASIKVAAELEGQIVMKEVEANIAARSLGADDADAKRLMNEVDELKRQRRQMDTGLDMHSAFQSIIPFGNAPEIGMEYFKRFRDVEIQEKLFALLFPMVEQAKVEEERNTPTLLVLDPPSLAERKVKPKRAIITVVAVLVAFIFVFSIALLIEFLETFQRLEPERYNQVRDSLRRLLPSFLIRWL